MTQVKSYILQKNGHYGRDCHSSIYALPKPDKSYCINIVEKFCKHCKKRGHNRETCWSLNERPKTNTSDRTRKDINKKTQDNNKNEDRKKYRLRKRHSDTERSSDEDEREEKNKTTRALEYQVTHVRQRAQEKTGLDLITLPIREAKHGKKNMIYDSGAIISLIKVKH